jgi:hypothetical protein
MKSKVVLAIIVATFILSACGLASPQPAVEAVVPTDAPPLPTATPIPPTPTPEPTPIPPTPTLEPTPIPPTPEPVEEVAAAEEAAPAEAAVEEAAAPALGRRLYATDFREGWPKIDEDGGTIKATSDGYLMEMQKQWALWSYTTTLDLDTSFYAETIVAPLSCPAGRTAYGIMFQYQDSKRFRYFVMSCEGEFFVVDRNLPGGAELLSGSVPEGVDPTTGKHSLGVLVSSDSIQAFINGQSVGVASLEGFDPLSGDIGIFAESGDQEFSVLFERLEVYEAD